MSIDTIIQRLNFLAKEITGSTTVEYATLVRFSVGGDDTENHYNFVVAQPIVLLTLISL